RSPPASGVPYPEIPHIPETEPSDAPSVLYSPQSPSADEWNPLPSARSGKQNLTVWHCHSCVSTPFCASYSEVFTHTLTIIPGILFPPVFPVQRLLHNRHIHWPAFPIAQVKNTQRSPLRLRFLACTL